MHRFAYRSLAAVLLSLAFAACGDETSPEEGHTPEGAALFVDGVDVSDGLLLVSGEPVRVEVRFLDHDGAEITGIEADHHAGLTFTPATLATVAAVDGENFQKDVTGQAQPETGAVMVGYGHDEAADDLSFGPFPVSVVVTGAVR